MIAVLGLRLTMVGIGFMLEKVGRCCEEPAPCADQDVVGVGAGNSAVEAALEVFRGGSMVTRGHLMDEIESGVKPWIVPDITNRPRRLRGWRAGGRR